jgi:hypothetical protein
MKRYPQLTAKLIVTAALAAAIIWISPGPAVQAQEGKKGGGKRGGPPGPDPIVIDDHTGFESIFDGTMKNWDADPTFWRAENNTLIGESTAEKRVTRNTFAIWRGGEPANFELKVDWKMNSTNSGIQYRSVELPDVGKWVLKGYQADIDFTNVYTGQLYEERGRGFLALRGQMATLQEGQKGRVIANLKTSEDLKGAIKVTDWNTMHIIARGNMLIHILNGQLMSVFVDEDAKNRAMSGLLGFQMHVGPPMKLEIRNIYLKKL